MRAVLRDRLQSQHQQNTIKFGESFVTSSKCVEVITVNVYISKIGERKAGNVFNLLWQNDQEDQMALQYKVIWEKHNCM